LKEDSDEVQEDTACVGITKHASLFGFTCAHFRTLKLHPTPEKVKLYWNLYKDNCDILVKVLHKPSTEALLFGSLDHLDAIPLGLEALVFSIYFSVVVSLSEQECITLLGDPKGELLSKYKAAMDQALARAGLLETEEIVILQALVIFLAGLRNCCTLRLMGTLTALAVRLAQNIGIHRDGTHFNLRPFEIEMRRRLWWNICLLDSRASEDSGYTASIHEKAADTQMPLNVNDDEWYPTMSEAPQPMVGYTELTFSLIIFEGLTVTRKLQEISSSGTEIKTGDIWPEKTRLISDFEQRLETAFINHCDPLDPEFLLITTVSRIITNKLRLISYYPYLRKDQGAHLTKETKDNLFLTSIQTVEHSMLLNTGADTSKWRWTCETYIRWYPLAFLLSELCTRTDGVDVQRAWYAVDAALHYAFREPTDSGETGGDDIGLPLNLNKIRNEIYKPLRRLITKAQAARIRAHSTEGSMVPTTSQNHIEFLENQDFAHNISYGSSCPTLSAALLNSYDIQPQLLASGKEATILESSTSFQDPIAGNTDPMQPVTTSDDILPTWEDWPVFPEVYEPGYIDFESYLSPNNPQKQGQGPVLSSGTV
jgi:hypothetical protein